MQHDNPHNFLRTDNTEMRSIIHHPTTAPSHIKHVPGPTDWRNIVGKANYWPVTQQYKEPHDSQARPTYLQQVIRSGGGEGTTSDFLGHNLGRRLRIRQ